jgi:hypothetical protein
MESNELKKLVDILAKTWLKEKIELYLYDVEMYGQEEEYEKTLTVLRDFYEWNNLYKLKNINSRFDEPNK